MRALVLLMCVGCAGVTVSEPRPTWMDAGIKRDGRSVYVSGQSAPKATEQEARDDALASAVSAFVKYAGVEVEAFDRSLELYSQSGSKTLQTMDIEQRNTVRARAFVRNASPEKWWTQRDGSRFVVAVYVKVPEEELVRVQKERDTKLALDVGLYRQGSSELELIGEGDVLKSGDAYGLFLTPSDGCYIYVFQTDAAGQTFRLFPSAQFKTSSNPVAAAAKLWIPNGEQFLTLDETVGKERIYIFASLDSMPELEAATTLEEKKLVSVIKTMGVAGLVDKRAPSAAPPPKPQMTKVDDLKKKLAGNGRSFVYETWFFHR